MSPPRTCHYCGVTTKVVEWGQPRNVAFNWDHVVPKSWGGRHKVRSCVPCNDAKGNNAPDCRCPTCTAAVHEWLGRICQERPFGSLSRSHRRRVALMLHRYVLRTDRSRRRPGKSPVRVWRWWVDSEGVETLSVACYHKGDSVFLWQVGTNVLHRVDRETEQALWDLAGQEARPRMGGGWL